ncbi:MAG: UvrD-helicase domain-containing protein [Halanaerobiales bacterium]|nr:UvrD-helicase domain-containing protein [Halanaerobiales bacterium]
MGFKPTSAQKEAIETTDQCIVLSAGAGSGKTGVLTQRYLHLISHRLANVDEILAITFTNKAAGEMKERILKEVNRRAIEADIYEEKDFWRNVKEDLNLAQISTFHSFCGQILRQNPLEVGVDPFFRIFDEIEADEILDETIEEIFLKGLDKGELSVITLVREFGIYAINDLLKNAYINSRPTNLDQLADKTLKLLSKSSQVLELLKTEICDLVEELLQINHSEKLAKGTKTKMDELEKNWPHLESSIREINFLTDKNRKSLIKLTEILKGRLAKSVSSQVKRIKEIVEEELNQYLADLRGLELIPSLVEVIKKIDENYLEKKRRLNGMDFADLERMTIQLLKNNSKICTSYREKFKFIMVDEFQDTNPTQEKLVRLLVGGSLDAAIQGNQLFIVGDPKQSIYRFRGADVTVFKGLKKEISKIGKDILLDVNFRSRGKIIDFVNHFFEKIFGTNENNRYDMNYQPSYSIRRGDPDDSCVEFMILDKSQLEENTNAREEEAKYLAHRIQKMVISEERLVYEGGKESGRKVSYGDICVLFQALTDVKIYEEALQKKHIPYSVVKGRGFFDRQEVQDVMNFLKIVDNPKREIEWVGVLRSPFCGLSDEDLALLLTKDFKIDQLIEKLEKNDELGEELIGWSSASAKMMSFFEVYKSIRENREKKAISSLIIEILSKTGYRQLMVTHTYGDLIRANLNKFTSMARQYEKDSFSSLYGFIKHIDMMEEKEVREGMAEIPGQNDCVQLMSIHQSKGLEFPIVILPDVGRQLINPTNFPAIFFDPELGLGLRVRDPLTDKSIKTSLSTLIWEEEKRRELSERKRLFYVAATRARDYLIISGAFKDFKTGEIDEGKNWLDWIAQVFDLSKPDEVPEELFYGKEQHRICVNPQIEELILEEMILEKTTSAQEMVEYETLSEMYQNLKVPSITPQRKNGYYEFSPTALMTYEKCPRWYYHRFVEKMPFSIANPLDRLTVKDNNLLQGAERGTLVHFLCEKARNIEEVPEILQKGVRQLGFNVAGPDALANILADIQPLMNNYFQHENDLYHMLETKEIKEKRELSFYLILDQSLIRGIIDRVIISEDEVIIFDYKTNQITEDEIEKESKKYLLQMEVYALAIYHLTGIERVQCKLYFLEPDRYWDFQFDLKELLEIQQKLSKLTDEIIQAECNVAVTGTYEKFACAAEPDDCSRHLYCSYQRLCENF